MRTKYLPIMIGLLILMTWLIPINFGKSHASTHKVFTVQATQYEFTPAVLKVNLGDTVTIHFQSTDVVHGFYIDEYGISLQADPGQTQSVTFVADKAGSFRFRCMVACGALHPFMIGKFNVGNNNLLIRSGLSLLWFTLGIPVYVPSHKAS